MKWVDGPVLTGKIVRFDDARGYGFVAPDSGDEDVFLHVNELNFDRRMLTLGTRVQFVAREGERGLKAAQVRIVDGPEPTVGNVVVGRAHETPNEDDLCDVVSTAELAGEITESLVTSVPTLTAEQIVRVRQCLVALARTHRWVED